MRRENINYLAVGSVVLLAGILLLYALYRLTGGVDENTVYFTVVGVVGDIRLLDLAEGQPVELVRIVEPRLDQQHQPGHPRRGVRGQEMRGVGHVFFRDHPPERRFGSHRRRGGFLGEAEDLQSERGPHPRAKEG